MTATDPTAGAPEPRPARQTFRSPHNLAACSPRAGKGIKLGGMNKAFVREPDDTGQRNCPRCGSLGIAVGPAAIDGHLLPDRARSVGRPAFFCPLPTCEVVYFDEFERAATTADLRAPVYPKDPAAPVCSCHGLTRDEIEEAARTGDLTRVREIIAQAKSPSARCAELSPLGRDCVAEVQRCFMRSRSSQQAD
ncbi:MAG: (2Fe-2S)-binding protein [Planctomycetaceae bacterium]|nr:(2Fe-2S)-binding protein [Planctomycetaceae bacterium]